MSEAATQEKAHPYGNFCWLELGTTDSDAAKKFYTSVFGWSYVDVPMEPDGGVYTMVNLGDKRVGALYKLGPQQQGVPPHWMTYVSVANADEAVAKARELGGTPVMEAFDVDVHGRMSVIKDPSGGVFAVWQAKEHRGVDLYGPPGSMCWNELQTRDTQKASEFYTKLFGWTTKESPEYTEWVNKGMSIGGMMAMNAQMEGVPPHWLPYISVTDCDKTAAAVKAGGGTLYVEPMDIPNVGRFSVAADPQGAVIAFIQLTGPHAQA
jgi:uncharacterized protein